jgi:hypothetical protein
MSQPRKWTEAEIDEMLQPKKRYFIARTPVSTKGEFCTISDIAAMLNSRIISEEFVAREITRETSGLKKTKDGAQWLPIAQLLAVAYKDKPLATVVLKDVEKNTFILSERYHTDSSPRSVVCGVVENYFDQHFKEFKEKVPREFLAYYKSDACPAYVITIKLEVGAFTVYRGTTGSKHAPHEETHPYTYDEDNRHELLPPEEFPSVALELKPPKYHPTAYLPIHLRPPQDI